MDTCRERIKTVQSLRDSIVEAENPSARRVLESMGEIDIHFDAGMNLSGLIECVHPDEEMRNAAEVCRQEMAKLSSELELDRDLYEVMVAIEPDASREGGESERYVEHTLRDYRRAGVDKDDQTRARIKKVNEELVALGQKFNKNIRLDTRSILLDGADDLVGLPSDYIEAHKPDKNGKIRITTDYPDLVPFLNYAKSGKHRKALHFVYHNRAHPDNLEVFESILARRHELAGILDHDFFASYATEDMMIRTSAAIERFIEDITALTRERSERDLGILIERKQKDDEDAKVIEEWERAYYSELVRSETLGFDSQEIRPYLEYGRVKDGVLAVTQRLFDLEYRRVSDPAWHESVETYDILEDGSSIGRFHLDMHPREGKYKHAAMFPIVSGVEGKQMPEVALVCNFPDPTTGTGPALLEHSEVVTFFHEFGHLLHHILGGSRRYVSFSGVATEWDFVEVPSQLLEEWAYSYEALSGFALHWETGEPVPEEMVKSMNRARRFGRSARVRQQMYYAALSLNYHNRDPEGMDTTDVLKEIAGKYSLHPYVEGTHMQASFGHLEGYSALYYTYMWSLVIARDLLNQFKDENIFDTETAVRYRKAVLEPGGSSDAADLIRDFLGREFNFDAYRRWLDEGEEK
ncbi:MAG: Zn-dependent oligopeptidase [Deltaproteobacteria bacterium]|nr:Zn-dependent oligopeptidase [Deltaproteobacteria bacterium]